ncbi:hypothetical protein HHI36_015233 [Cryptolaemus montrouzieri]|uniref:Uncharacterized protein n=1 Tax=Cryptolaemus montrouzieri TaxID=559131 RepID=A0ABD2N534_9CUCU
MATRRNTVLPSAAGLPFTNKEGNLHMTTTYCSEDMFVFKQILPPYNNDSNHMDLREITQIIDLIYLSLIILDGVLKKRRFDKNSSGSSSSDFELSNFSY